jgi:hypothetical protein
MNRERVKLDTKHHTYCNDSCPRKYFPAIRSKAEIKTTCVDFKRNTFSERKKKRRNYYWGSENNTTTVWEFVGGAH